MFEGKLQAAVSERNSYYNGVQQRLVKLRNELQAQKTASVLAYGSVLFPENVPEASWSGVVTTDFSDAIMAAFRATFRRSDGINTTPLVDFTSDYIAPTMADWVRAQGGTATGRDLSAEAEDWVQGYIDKADGDSVSYIIEFLNGIGAGQSSANISLSVRAISPVKGELTLERIK